MYRYDDAWVEVSDPQQLNSIVRSRADMDDAYQCLGMYTLLLNSNLPDTGPTSSSSTRFSILQTLRAWLSLNI